MEYLITIFKLIALGITTVAILIPFSELKKLFKKKSEIEKLNLVSNPPAYEELNLVSNPPAYEKTVKAKEELDKQAAIQAEIDEIKSIRAVDLAIKEAINEGRFSLSLSYGVTYKNKKGYYEKHYISDIKKVASNFVSRGFTLVEKEIKTECVLNKENIMDSKYINNQLKERKLVNKKGHIIYNGKLYKKYVRVPKPKTGFITHTEYYLSWDKEMEKV